MMATIGTLVMNVIANTAAFEAGLRKARGELDAFVTAIAGMLPSLTAAAAVDKTLGFLSASYESFRQAQDAAIKLDAVLAATGNTAKLTAFQMADYASELQRATRFSDEAITNAETLLATFGAVSGETFKRTIRAALDLSSVFGTDLDSSVRLLGRALVAPEEGFARLSRMGVVFTDSQKAMITALAEGGQTIEAQNALLAELEKRVGGVANAMGQTQAGKMARFWNAVDDSMEAAGALLVPDSALTIASGMARATSDWATSGERMAAQIADGAARLESLDPGGKLWSESTRQEIADAAQGLRELAHEYAGLAAKASGSDARKLARISGQADAAYWYVDQFAGSANQASATWSALKQLVGGAAGNLPDPLSGLRGLSADSHAWWKNVEKMAHEMGVAAKHANEMGQRLTESVMTPLEHYQKTLADAQGLLNVGAIDDATFGRVRAKALQELGRGAFPDRGPSVTPLALQGSQDAFRLIDELRNRPLEQNMLKTEEEILAEAKTQSELLQQMVDDAVQLHVVRLN